MLSVNGRRLTRKIGVGLKRWKGAQSTELDRLSSAGCSHVWLLGGREIIIRCNSSSQTQGLIDSKTKSYPIQRGYLLLFIFLSASQFTLSSCHCNIQPLHHQVPNAETSGRRALRCSSTSHQIIESSSRCGDLCLYRRVIGSSASH